MKNIDDFLADFHTDPGYFDYANFGPISDRVASESRISLDLLAKARYGSLEYLDDIQNTFQSVFGQLTGFDPENVVFQPSLEFGLFQILNRCEGKLMLSDSDSLPMLRAAVHSSQNTGKVRLQWIEADHGRMTPGVIRQSLTEFTTAVAFSLVHPVTGFVADLEGIREVVGDRLLIVDATDAFGVLPVDYQLADVVAVSGRSWLRAGFGTGFLALSEKAQSVMAAPFVHTLAADSFNATSFNATSFDADTIEDGNDFMLTDEDPAALARLIVAGELILDFGLENISAEITENAIELIELFHSFGLQTMPNTINEVMSGIVCVACPQNQVSRMTAAFHNHGISVSQMENVFRFSVHAGTDPESFDLLRQALTEFSV